MVAKTYPKMNLAKAVEAAAELLRAESGGRMDYIRLLKLLYLADRESLRRFGKPITYDRYVAMKFGPVLSEVYDLIKGQHVDAPLWSKVIKTDRYSVVLEEAEAPRNEHLSRAEIAILHSLSTKYRDVDNWSLVDQLHADCKEWDRNAPEGNGARPIEIKHVLEALGFDDAESSEIIDSLAEEAALDRFFDGHN
jgi:uncharacterized phage-associated protein